ncbi:MAG: (d)CMP kinase [Clostridia bacterium]|nr:(d)CMP kinase [Clostridia bacterium]
MLSIAIDGPAGAGKSTIARLLAKELHFWYLDTGAMYRAVTWAALQQGLDLTEPAALVDLIQNNRLELQAEFQKTKVFWNQTEITEAIRTPEVSQKVSLVAQIPEVRRLLVEQQQHLAATQNTVMEGRDIGTRVLPQAVCKFFLTASPQVRAQRRAEELKQKGFQVDLDHLIKEIQDRDYLDSHRADSPLQPAQNAIQIDCSHLQIAEVLALMLKKFAEVTS